MKTDALAAMSFREHSHTELMLTSSARCFQGSARHVAFPTRASRLTMPMASKIGVANVISPTDRHGLLGRHRLQTGDRPPPTALSGLTQNERNPARVARNAPVLTSNMWPDHLPLHETHKLLDISVQILSAGPSAPSSSLQLGPFELNL